MEAVEKALIEEIEKIEDETKIAAEERVKEANVAPNLFEIELAAGDMHGFDINFPGWTGNVTKYNAGMWLDKGYDGVHFICKTGRTRIIPRASHNIMVGPHNGIVKLSNVDIGSNSIFGNGSAIHFGTVPQPYYENFKLILDNFSVFSDLNLGPRGVWGVFSWQADVMMTNGVFNLANLNEHGFYAHGFAKQGVYVDNLTVNGAGAECLKFTARPGEVDFVPNVWAYVRNSTFKNWYQPHSWRGGAGFVSQASTCNILIEDCYYYGNETDYNRSKCIMIDGNAGGDYNVFDGSIGSGPSTGHVIVRRTSLSGAQGPSWFAPIMRIGNNSGNPQPHCAKSLLMDTCGVYGKNRQIQVHGQFGDSFKGRGVIRNCNTPWIRDFLFGRGVNVEHESMIDKPGGFVPVSQGLFIPRN